MFTKCRIYTLLDKETLDKDMCVNNIKKYLKEIKKVEEKRGKEAINYECIHIFQKGVLTRIIFKLYYWKK